MRSASSRPPQSLRTKFIAALLVGGLCVALVGTWHARQTTAEGLQSALLDRARTLGSVITHAAAVAPDIEFIDHILQRVSRDEPDILSLGIFLEAVGRAAVLAGADAAGSSLDRLAGTPLGDRLAETLARGTPYHFFDSDRTLTVLMPLDPGVSGVAPGGRRGALLIRLHGTSAIDGVNTIMWRNLPGVLAPIAVMVLLAYMLMQLHVLRPIAAIETVGQRRRDGSDEARVPVFGNREFAYLAETLNTGFDSCDAAQGRLAAANEQLSAALKQADADRAKAVAADRAKSRFLANMSHELRTPLNSIIGFSDIIGNEALGPSGVAQYREYANDINHSGQHLLALINDILDLSKIESGKEEINEEAIELPPVVRSTVSLVRERAAEKCLAVELDFAQDLPLLRADRRKLTQILVNLLTNAVKFTEAGGRVSVAAWQEDDGGCVLRVADTGIGIAPADIPKALSQFGQVQNELCRTHEGTGLGLPLTKALVELHGGRFEIHSALGEGTRALVRFPPWRSQARRPALTA